MRNIFSNGLASAGLLGRLCLPKQMIFWKSDAKHYFNDTTDICSGRFNVKQARKLQATLVSKLCRLTDSLTDGGEV